MMGNATLTIKFELEPGDEDAMYRLEALLLSDPAWRAGAERGLACALIVAFDAGQSVAGEWGIRARLVRLDDERGANVWRFVVE
jgi:hypothetical protein